MIIVGDKTNLDIAKKDALEKAQAYFRSQLLKDSPDVGAIFSTVKNYVDDNPPLLKMMNNQIDLMRLAYAWPVLDLTTNTGKARYLMAAQNIIALLT